MEMPVGALHNKKSRSIVGSQTKHRVSSRTTTAISNHNEEQEENLLSYFSDNCNYMPKKSSFCSDDQLAAKVGATAAAAKNALLQDPHEVLRASLEFQRSSTSNLIREREQKRSDSNPQLPAQNDRASMIMSSSLYPSTEFVSRAASDFDFERTWSQHELRGDAASNVTGIPPAEAISTNDYDLSESILNQNEENYDGIHDDPRDLKIAADGSNNDFYEAANSLERIMSNVTPGIVSTDAIEAEAKVIAVEYERIHPLEEESIVQAELIENDYEQEQQPQISRTRQHWAAKGTSNDNTDNFNCDCEPSNNNEIATEATDIESGPLEKATIAAWSGHSNEALVFHQEDDFIPFKATNNLDAKASSLQSRSEQNHANTGGNAGERVDTDACMMATIEDYNIHPSETTNCSVQAELIGNSSTDEFPLNGVGGKSLRSVNIGSRVEGDATDRPTEATVLDSGPPDKATVDAWSTRPLEEVQVLRENGCRNFSVAVDDEVPRILPCATVCVEDISNGADQAEIVEISENFHPAELELERATRAQLIRNSTSSSDSGRINENDAESSIPTTKSQSQILYEAHTLDPTSATPTFVGTKNNRAVNSYDFFSNNTQNQLSDARISSANGVDNLGNEESVPTQTFSHECEVDDDYCLDTPIVRECTECPKLPEPRSFSSTVTPAIASHVTSIGTTRSTDTNRSECTLASVKTLSKNISKSTNTMIEILFGNSKPSSAILRNTVSFEMDSFTTSVSPRILLPSTVIHSEATQSWVATLNTNQKALDAKNIEESSRALRAFSVPTMKQAVCLAKAWAPPRMHLSASNPQCFICQSNFAVFNRSCHCRNCGVCICNSCAVQWPSKMIPTTYNIKNENIVNICKACDWLCSGFRLALLKGESDKAIALHATGNVNLTTPFANIKGEVFYPVHCAVLGRSLSLLKWLVEENCCPLKSIRIGTEGNSAHHNCYTPILTSKSRSLLNIALSNKSIDIMRYLVVEKGMLLNEERDLPVDTLLQNLDSILRVLPTGIDNMQTHNETLVVGQNSDMSSDNSAKSPTTIASATSSPSFGGTVDTNCGVENMTNLKIEESPGLNSSNECILCYSNQIDSVVMPCGHQMCCMECSKSLVRCPVCQCDCSFVRVFRA